MLTKFFIKEKAIACAIAFSDGTQYAFPWGRELVGVDADLLLTASLVLELDLTVDQSEEGVVGAHADVVAGMNSGASLSDDDIAGDNGLTVGLLNAKSLGLGITTVLGRTYAFLMSKEL